MEVEDLLSDLYQIRQNLFSGRVRSFSIGRHRSRQLGKGYRTKKISRWTRGDPSNLIDWQLSLKTWPKEVFMNETIENKETPLFVAIDATPSMMARFSHDVSKLEIAMKIMAVLSFTATRFGDPVGAASFGTEDDQFMLPKHGRRRTTNLIANLLGQGDVFYKSIHKKNIKPGSVVGINECLADIISRLRRQSTVIIISDFIDVLYEKIKLNEDHLLGLASRHKDNLIFIMIDDLHELGWSGGVGTILSRNIETGQVVEIRANEASELIAEHVRRQEAFKIYLESRGIESLIVSTHDWLDKVTEFFASR